MEKKNLILEKSFQFSLKIIELCEILEQNRKFVIANQLLKSGISIGANIREAQNAESQQDFVHKLKIAAKEAEETMYWLELCQHSPNYPNTEQEPEKLLEIIKIVNKIIGTIKRQVGN